MKTWSLFLTLLILPLVWGCGQPNGSGVEVLVPAEQQGNDTTERVKTGQKVYRPPVLQLVPEPEMQLVNVNNGAGVINPDFNEHVDQVPSYWEIRGRVMARAKGPDMSMAAHASNPRGSMELRQQLVFDEPPAGKLITLSAQAHSNLPDLVSTRIELADGTSSQGDPHSGDGTWQLLTTSLRVPDDYDSDIVTIALIAKPSSSDIGIGKGPTFDDVNVKVTE